MFFNKNHHIVLVSVDGDPAVKIGQQEAGRQRVEAYLSWYSVASGLNNLYTDFLTQNRVQSQKQPQIAA
ncbi:MAG: hypothetical protein KME32_29885 [Mojavia pulchra JT2-VF2]|jgi:hypothetical protein|uniref:Uncharacterized protein n=1 Tax=Mojavia pulchra JT2-VF2 TaxID=287848 RepID=A0A951Q3X2_9NOST|nr:hypothetical protein [Mojavia pulchra JT2-VF2]